VKVSLLLRDFYPVILGGRPFSFLCAVPVLSFHLGIHPSPDYGSLSDLALPRPGRISGPVRLVETREREGRTV